MLNSIEQTNRVCGHHLSGGAVQEQPFSPMPATSNGISMSDGEAVSTPADPRKLASVGSPTLGNIAVQKNVAETALGARLVSVDIHAVGALLHRLNLELRNSARLDRQAARDSDIAAQDAAAKALRASGLLQLVGTLLTSTFAIAGAGASLKGASKAQARFDEEIGGLKSSDSEVSTKAELCEPAPKLATENPPLVDEAGTSLKGASKAQARFDEEIEEIGGLKSSDSEVSTKAELSEPAPKLATETPSPVDEARIYRANQVAQEATMTWSGVSTGITEVGKIGGAGSNMGATIEQQKQAELEAEATKMHSRADDESEFKSSYETMIQDVLQTLSEVRRADAETRSKIANMG
ncbi:hypothetical protein EOA60_19805 [Mesorhizobium sp. M1A.F.Ca.IN.020.06.1.1]|uniref:type III secretion system translocon subunit SctB n=3 Tax=Mesorhizobium TaxID=68287 RepID=UPI000FD22DF5|nr:MULTISPECIES: type III secretion system translocon subunit SctB [unclassified Mesorhizobium]RUV82729.1 hypothetical protein EOA51_27560 [Mesorhizobium sp. M1A.F.Ca.IN.020.32.1.1]RUW25425.1 hypothetical protein EOA60_19805 [Mesorhizobium sp. M1A.F.Ca.IN.020.06.1.1]RWF82317.1 MAG: hypothetical protein EOQ35_10705 [Mesorhizobium sp.]TIN62459.1 MAG: hypothetical protein E5Y26_19325 [Mesorhizobium sp.]